MPVIDLSFVLVGNAIPLDHGYALFSALCGSYLLCTAIGDWVSIRSGAGRALRVF